MQNKSFCSHVYDVIRQYTAPIYLFHKSVLNSVCGTSCVNYSIRTDFDRKLFYVTPATSSFQVCTSPAFPGTEAERPVGKRTWGTQTRGTQLVSTRGCSHTSRFLWGAVCKIIHTLILYYKINFILIQFILYLYN